MNSNDADVVQRRAVYLGAFLLVVAMAYIVAFFIAKAVVATDEKTFHSAAIDSGPPLDVYLEVTAIDAIRESMEVRLDVATGPGVHGTQYFGTLKRDVELRVSDGETEQAFRLRRDERLSSLVFVAGLQGAVNRYPFDRYATSIAIIATDLSSANHHKTIPVRVTVWEGLPVWLVSVANGTPFDDARTLSLAFSVYRPGGLVFFSSIIYCLMVLIAICALVIGALGFVGVRRIEVTLVGALAAMVFALPILRNVLPGAPPLGVLADLWVFLWAVIAATIGLMLFVTAWVQRGPRP